MAAHHITERPISHHGQLDIMVGVIGVNIIRLQVGCHTLHGVVLLHKHQVGTHAHPVVQHIRGTHARITAPAAAETHVVGITRLARLPVHTAAANHAYRPETHLAVVLHDEVTAALVLRTAATRTRLAVLHTYTARANLVVALTERRLQLTQTEQHDSCRQKTDSCSADNRKYVTHNPCVSVIRRKGTKKIPHLQIYVRFFFQSVFFLTAALNIKHSTLNTQLSTLNIQHYSCGSILYSCAVTLSAIRLCPSCEGCMPSQQR